MRVLRVFLKGYNGHYIDFPFPDEGFHFANLMGFWKMEGILYRENPMFGVPAAVPYDSWAFVCVLAVESTVQPGTSFDFFRPHSLDDSKPN